MTVSYHGTPITPNRVLIEEMAGCVTDPALLIEAADTIARLQAALERFVAIVDGCEGFDPDVEQQLMDEADNARSLVGGE